MPMSPSATRVRDPRNLLPAANTHGVQVFMPVVPSERISPFTFGRGTVLWRIWPAVLLHTVFAALVITISDYTVKLAIPNVLLTVCGVVIGFVLSYRASSGYDRYWMGRSAWGDLMRNARTLARLIWFHVPARLTPGTEPAPEHEARQVMREKRMAIKLIEGFAVATKHHLRGEMTIFYQDLFPIVEPLHLHPRRERGPPPEEEPKKRPSLLVTLGSRISSAVSKVSSRSSSSSLAKGKQSANASSSSLSVPGALSASPATSTDLLLPASPPHVSIHIAEAPSTPANAPAVAFAPSSDRDALLPKAANGNGAYGTFSDLPDSPATLKPITQPNPSELSLSPSETSSENGSEDEHHCGEDCDHEHTPLFPSSLSDADRAKLPKIATELVAFSSFVEMLSPTARRQAPPPARGQQPPIDGQPMSPTGSAIPDDASVMQVDPVDYVSHYDRKHRPRIPGGGENIPLQVLWCISDWLATCEKRNTVPGTSLGTTIATLGALEDALGQLEKILMTPLPFVYSVHIRHVVWVYMFCMPFQLVDPFGVWTIPGVAIAAFFFLGLLAAGEEIEQPFGYDENDLNLDLFTNEMVHNELAELVHTPGINVLQRHVGANGTIAGLCAPRNPHVDGPSDAPRERPKSAYVASAPAAPGHSHDAVPQHIAGASEVPHVPVHHDPGVHTLPVTSQ